MRAPQDPSFEESPKLPSGLDAAPRQSVASQEDMLVADTNQLVAGGDSPGSKRYESHTLVARTATTIRSGPLPDPKTLRDLAKIYPEAPKVIFDEFQAQAAHRRYMEKRVVDSNISKSRVGQYIGGLIAFTGLVGSFIIVAMGHSIVGVASVMAVIGGTVGVFVLGRDSQRRERVEKEAMRTKIARGEHIRNLEGGTGTDD